MARKTKKRTTKKRKPATPGGPAEITGGASSELIVVTQRQAAFRASAGRFLSAAGENVKDVSSVLKRHGALMVPVFGPTEERMIGPTRASADDSRLYTTVESRVMRKDVRQESVGNTGYMRLCMYRLICAVILCYCNVGAADSLVFSRFIGIWESTQTPTPTEMSILCVSDTSNATFERKSFGDSVQVFNASSESIELVDDVMIIDFTGAPITEGSSKVSYKLALGQFEHQRVSRLAGTMFMYLDGNLVNGMHVAYKKKAGNSVGESSCVGAPA